MANAIEITQDDTRSIIGQAANAVAARHAFDDYLSRKAQNTLRRHYNDLALFARFLGTVQFNVSADDLQRNPDAWRGITWGLVKAFQKWMLEQGYAIASINARLSAVKIYAALAFDAGSISADDHEHMRAIKGYQQKEVRRVDEQRQIAGIETRRGAKKAANVSLTGDHADALKNGQPDTPQGRRDALLMCLLLDHGLRCGEIAGLEVSAFDLRRGTMTFYRPKVDKEQTHRLTADTLRAVRAYFDNGHAPATGKLLRASAKSKSGDKLGAAGMSERAITKRVNALGKRIGVDGLSAHDARHFCATDAAESESDIRALMDTFGWTSPAMAVRYIEAASVANERIKQGARR